MRLTMSQRLNMLLLISTVWTKPNRLLRVFSALRLFFQNLCCQRCPLGGLIHRHRRFSSLAYSPPFSTFLPQVWVFVQLRQHVWDPWRHWGAEAHGHGLRPGGGQVFRRGPKGGTKLGAQSPGALRHRSVQTHRLLSSPRVSVKTQPKEKAKVH